MGRRYLKSIASSWIVAAGLGLGMSSPFAHGQTPEIVPAAPAPPDEGPAPTPAVDLDDEPKPIAEPVKPKRPKIAGDFKGVKDDSVKKASALADDDDGAAPNLPVAELPPPGSLDPDVMKAQTPGDKPAAAPPSTDTGPVPVATEGGPGPIPPQGIPGDAKSFVLPTDRVPLGRQSMGLSVDVVGPEFWNINQVCVLKIVVKNTGAADAMGVSVRDELPDGLTFVSSQPDVQPIGSLLTWSLGIIPANSERVISVSVRPTKTGAFDHAATVTMLAGGKSRTIVREPKLKVEQTATTGKILKGQPAQFKIVISNPGDGPARNVYVRAKLSAGLKHESAATDQILEQKLDVIPSGGRVVLNTLEADTLVGGEQACEVSAESQDVVAGAPEARNRTTVMVIEPKLVMKLLGPDKRFTDMLATYDITMENPGTSPAKNVVVQALLPVGGRLHATPPGATFIQQGRKIVWKKAQLDPAEKVNMTFKVQMGGIGVYQVAAESKADGGLLAKDIISTDVSGLADVDLDITESRRAVDVGEMTVYKIKIINRGTKEATKILVSAKIPDTVEPRETSGTEVEGEFQPATRTFVFPQIDRLGPGKQIELGIKVEAVKPGEAICRVELRHEEMAEKLEDLAVFKVEKVRR